MQDVRDKPKRTVADRFDRADGYDRQAMVQQDVAQALAATIAAMPLPANPRVLEIGCGTGALADLLLDRLPGVRWLATDIAPTMVERARARLGARPGTGFAVMDGERPDQPGPFDLICSSLAMQWFTDLPGGIARLRGLLAPGGRIAFTTLAKGSFAEWRAAHGASEVGLHDYPDAKQLATIGLRVTIQDHCLTHPDARDFLRSLKTIGADMPRPGYRPLSPAALRRIMTRFEEGGAIARYVVATCLG